ncbi:hypothetical protein SDC9_111485 [bioreactor metagenome]|uniref:Uncharacterized protein n=1 Tax=bioreactor metagenome TaxID=1076179 RepID=A0A645BHL7_9ZZZZ
MVKVVLAGVGVGVGVGAGVWLQPTNIAATNNSTKSVANRFFMKKASSFFSPLRPGILQAGLRRTYATIYQI